MTNANSIVFARDIFSIRTIFLRIVNVQKVRVGLSGVLATKTARSDSELVSFWTLESGFNKLEI